MAGLTRRVVIVHRDSPLKMDVKDGLRARLEGSIEHLEVVVTVYHRGLAEQRRLGHLSDGHHVIEPDVLARAAPEVLLGADAKGGAIKGHEEVLIGPMEAHAMLVTPQRAPSTSRIRRFLGRVGDSLEPDGARDKRRRRALFSRKMSAKKPSNGGCSIPRTHG